MRWSDGSLVQASSSAMASIILILAARGAVGASIWSPSSRSHLRLEVGNALHCNSTNNALKVRRFTTSLTTKNDLIQMLNFTITRQSTDRLKQLSIAMTKCSEYVSSNTCEHWQSWKFRANICGLINDANTPWYPLTSSFQPNLSCPMRKGDYYLHTTNIFNLQLLEKIGIPLEKNVWQNRIEIDDNVGPYLCFIMDKVTYVRVRSH